MPKLIDTHAHLNFNAFKNDVDKVVRQCLANDVWMINVGTKYETSQKAVELAQKYEKGVFAAIGLHPIHLDTGLVKIKNDTEEVEVHAAEEFFDYQKYEELAKSPKVVAIGEVGLDYYWRPKTTKKKELFKQKQKDLLTKQLDLAKELNLPVIFHCRMAYNDLVEILRKRRNINKYTPDELLIKGVVHCFAGSWQQAQRFLEMGFCLGFNGIIFKKIKDIDFEEVIRNTPLDRVLLETDCPYLAPPPTEGRNDPLTLKYIVERVAKIKNLSYEKVAEATTENAKKLFSISI
ncbi:MAG: hypothetical protein G01um101430_547 [Parcubacteria group bacterium Gr01-1014_30]|nr:MAG: hypothetical protein G01um101430_547 [Parcubacteria group bacterium Gr01-1014_30]